MIQGIKYYSFYEKSGYANAAHAYLHGLMALGVPVSWHPLQANDIGVYLPMKTPEADMGALQSLFHADAPCDVVILHVIPEYYQRCLASEAGKFIVAYSTWETDTLPPSWLPLLQLAHLVVVPSQWNRAVYEKTGCTVPVRVVPHIFTPPQPAPGAVISGVRPTDFVFYNIGIWSSRKDTERLVEAYLRAFTAKDPVVLVLKTSRHNYRVPRRGRLRSRLWRWFGTSRRAVRALRRKYRCPARIILLDTLVSGEKIEALHQRGDAYAALPHAEGWGLGAFEAAGRDKPVMITGYGGQLDYLPAHLAHLIEYQLVPVEVGPGEGRNTYRPEHLWAEADIDHAVRTLRKIYDNRQSCAASARDLGTYVRSQFSMDKISRTLVAAMEEFKSPACRVS